MAGMPHLKRLAVVLSLGTLSAVHAQNAAPEGPLIGAGVWSRPAYEGASSQTTALIPVVRYYGRPWFARTTFGVLEGGVRTEVARGLTVGAQLAYEGGRESSESTFLSERRLPSLPASASWGAHVEFEKDLGPVPFIALLRYRQDVDTARGAQTDLRLTAGVYQGAGIKAGVFVQTTWADAKAGQYYHGLGAQQAAQSGLPAFEAQGGTLFNAAGLLWSYDLTSRWMLLGSVESRWLRGDAIDSPLTRASVSRYASVGLAYQF